MSRHISICHIFFWIFSVNPRNHKKGVVAKFKPRFYKSFSVTKTRADGRPSIRRNLCLTETCLIERDPATYQPTSLRSLKRITGLVRFRQNPQEFWIEYDDRTNNRYLSPERDALLVRVSY